MWLWEIYGSTEGNVQLANVMDDEACIMRFTPIVQVIISQTLVYLPCWRVRYCSLWRVVSVKTIKFNLQILTFERLFY